jgi:hypothetical protein
MNYYIDTEFYEDGKQIHLISIGIVCEDGRELYCENGEFNWEIVPNDHWIQQNVRPHLEHGDGVWCAYTKAELRFAIQQFVFDGNSKPVFYGYFADYDWVVMCQLFGRMVDLPSGFPKYCIDLKQTMHERGLSKEWKQAVCPDPEDDHHALVDARWNMALHRALMDLGSRPEQGKKDPTDEWIAAMTDLIARHRGEWTDAEWYARKVGIEMGITYMRDHGYLTPKEHLPPIAELDTKMRSDYPDGGKEMDFTKLREC